VKQQAKGEGKKVAEDYPDDTASEYDYVETSSEEGESNNGGKKAKGEKKEADNQKKPESNSSKYSHSRFSSNMQDLEEEFDNMQLAMEAKIGEDINSKPKDLKNHNIQVNLPIKQQDQLYTQAKKKVQEKPQPNKSVVDPKNIQFTDNIGSIQQN